MLFHFSEDPSIVRFVPHVPRTNPAYGPAVWAIDEAHAPLYWFPRDCPRVTAWPRNSSEAAAFRDALDTDAHRVHAIETDWLDRMSSTVVYRYELDAADFGPWEDASGQWICDHEIAPLSVAPIGDLLALHRKAGIELRVVNLLWPLRDLAHRGPWDFSTVRMGNARPRDDERRLT
ncbi:hypothetical protein BH10ACT2_BH10ACT2_19740 [soil metagenome]